jgi:hypothetical protein
MYPEEHSSDPAVPIYAIYARPCRTYGPVSRDRKSITVRSRRRSTCVAAQRRSGRRDQMAGSTTPENTSTTTMKIVIEVTPKGR